MRVDLETLRRNRRYEDPGAGISEEFLQPSLGLGRTVAVLSRPLSPSLNVGWVMCHSYGMEQVHLGRLDVIVARDLSRAGFPVLRFHGQGYGDAESAMEKATPSSHVAECRDAVKLMTEELGIPTVWVFGARFGGTVAALTAEQLGLTSMVLVDPMTKGERIVRDLVRSQVLADMIEFGEDGGKRLELNDLDAEFARKGWVDIKGFPLTEQGYREFVDLDLIKDVTSFSGSALLVAVSRTQRIGAGLTSLHHHLEKLGGESTIEVIEDPVAPQFGQFRWRAVEGGQAKRDTQLELNERIAEVTVEWARAQVGGAPSPSASLQTSEVHP